jgi:homoserine kinase
MIVRVPASSANLGPGFDAVGMALDLCVTIGDLDLDAPVEGARAVDEHHPAAIANRVAGGNGRLWCTGAIPAGRGLGFSGAVRVGGAAVAVLGRNGGALDDEVRREVLAVVAPLEGHPDNVAASLYGGVVVAAAGTVVRVPLAPAVASLRVVAWVPQLVTKTDESRRVLGAPVAFDDVVANIGRVSLLVGALASGDIDVLDAATRDRLHQPARLHALPACAEVIEIAREAGALAAWLSGSGPTVAAFVEEHRVAEVVVALEGRADPAASAHCKVLAIDHDGLTTR